MQSGSTNGRIGMSVCLFFLSCHRKIISFGAHSPESSQAKLVCVCDDLISVGVSQFQVFSVVSHATYIFLSFDIEPKIE